MTGSIEIMASAQSTATDLSFLIVEDEDVVRLALSRRFARYGHVETAASVERARQSLDRRRFDAILVDVELRDGSGFEVLAYARAHAPDMLALVLSGAVDATRLSQAFSLGVAYLVKPASSTQLDRFALEARARHLKNTSWLRALIGEWVARYGLTPAEEQVLALALDGNSRTEIAERRAVTAATLKKQVQSLLAKTGDSSLESATNRALRSALLGKR